MKKIFGALFALASSAAFAATLVPIQLLNPTGSSSGQAIVSTGASSAPAWGGIGLNGIASISANTVLANATASSAAPTAFAMPSCSTSASALNWTTSTGFTCNTAVNAAQLSGNAVGTSGAAVPLLNGTNTWSGAQTFTSSITPSQTAGIVGTTTNNNANAGSVGEYISSSIAVGSAVALTNNTPANITSISLTAGDWRVCGQVAYSANASTTTQQFVGWISTTSATLPGAPNGGAYFAIFPYGIAGNGSQTIFVGCERMSLSATTTVYLSTQAAFSVSTLSGYGFIGAERRR